MKRTARVALLVALPLSTFSGTVHAQDKTLTEGRPLTRLGDAFPIGPGEGALYVGVTGMFQRSSANRADVPIQIVYGPFPQTQLGLGTTLSSRPHDPDDPHAGDLTGSLRVNFGRETFFVPSLAAAFSVTVPTGVDAKATIYELKGYASKTLGFSLYGHFNVAIDVADRVGRGERRARYSLALGVNHPLPEFASLVLAADVFSDQSSTIGQPNTTGVEAGVRYRLTPDLYWDVGVGSELIGPRDRSAFFVTTGFTWGFTLGGGP
ncbi:MAG TPA: hypothetical protein VK548_22250 [Candidatus Acidoferrum sp.]|nr:hypothetical protein [Candidatus Acidoferrum sp.]